MVLINNPCLEIWFLLHFKFTSKPFKDCSETENMLKRYLSDYEKSQKYYKNRRLDIYKRLRIYLQKAIKNGKKLGTFDFKNMESPKAEIYKIFGLLFDE